MCVQRSSRVVNVFVREGRSVFIKYGADCTIVFIKHGASCTIVFIKHGADRTIESQHKFQNSTLFFGIFLYL